MPMTHRPATEQDIQTVCGFAQDAQELFFFFPKAQFPLTPRQLSQAVAERADATVVELDGEVVAFANFYRWETEGRCSIGNVVVAPAARGRGAARYLMEQMIALALTKYRAREVTVSCFNQNLAGLLLYPKLGFEPFAVEERVGPAGNRAALIHMRFTASA
ncbi:GNAT family N-acetyltransferase [Stutzerimonas stutzeri]|jgi:ribosomal protein S18 acetylase RimI-like enzyme|uniref:Ribosomal protein S18 acetylase RimI-like enzyme n=1 Tax=Stutzerimonas stutzeri TaxID=316 RepID=A0A5S5BDS4_STUST|nr:GNAT family N-acetyltransferase [Stutzerimonas stutzeri]TYP64210.1 ribosomal protein S18 acetylase RimI-like enzyme [Stutzerimonas stutzeri]